MSAIPITVIHHSADWIMIGGPMVVSGKTEWFCRCVCGVEKWVRENNLKSGRSKNCGCKRRADLANRNRRRLGGIWVDHARAAHAWDRMIRRCYDQKSKGFKNWGGRGIQVCLRWIGESGLKNFISDMGDPPIGTSLGRIDNDAGYSPENCRWETNEQQQSNTRRSIYGFLYGKKMTAAQIGRAVGKHGSTIAKEIRKGIYANNCGVS